ncbi:MAG: sulfite exporter TauE/SafE family protein [Promethearchaeota archaeon]|nr:MAG: sulfite exporter TauE/SafE family protein [Candidatus Lokiarchaeota archaeon]
MVLTAGSFILLFSITLAGSFLASMVGIGGGVLFVPILVAFFGLDVPEARTISLFCMIFVTLSATIGYFRHNVIDWKLGLIYDIFAIPGVLLGKWIADILYEIIRLIVVVVALWTLASLILIRKTKKGVDDKDHSIVKVSFMDEEHHIQLSQSKKWVFSLISSFFGGFVTGCVGMGGGTVYTSTMILLGLTPLISVATAEFSMIFTNTFGFFSAAIFPLIPWDFPGFGTETAPILWNFILPMGIASLIGAFAGTILSRRVKGGVLKKMLAIIAILMGIPIILEILGLWNF